MDNARERMLWARATERAKREADLMYPEHQQEKRDAMTTQLTWNYYLQMAVPPDLPLDTKPVLRDIPIGIIKMAVDAGRWRWLREQGGWPVSEAAASGQPPEWFDHLVDEAIIWGQIQTK